MEFNTLDIHFRDFRNSDKDKIEEFLADNISKDRIYDSIHQSRKDTNPEISSMHRRVVEQHSIAQEMSLHPLYLFLIYFLLYLCFLASLCLCKYSLSYVLQNHMQPLFLLQ